MTCERLRCTTQTALERQDLCRMYLAHHELEHVTITIIIIIIIIIIVIIIITITIIIVVVVVVVVVVIIIIIVIIVVTCVRLRRCQPGQQWGQPGPGHRGRPPPAHCRPAAGSATGGLLPLPPPHHHTCSSPAFAIAFDTLQSGVSRQL